MSWARRLFSKIRRLFYRPCLLSYDELVKLVHTGVIDAPLSAVNGSSIDVTLHHLARKEVLGPSMGKVRLSAGESIETAEIDISGGYTMIPDSVLLASTVETINLPLWLSATFSLKSTLGRNFVGHQLAGHCDPGFSGRITLELTNDNQFNKIILDPGMPIGQLLFWKHAPVPEEFSYRKRGQYNGQDKVRAAGVVR